MPEHQSTPDDGSDCDSCSNSGLLALLVVLAVLLIALVAWPRKRAHAKKCALPVGPVGEHMAASPQAAPVVLPPKPTAERKSVHEALTKLYSSADVDPLITGNLYGDKVARTRNVYAQRTSHGDVWGLTEYSSAGGRGDVGVDVGPYGMNEYGGRSVGYDDGIPETWIIPSTPIRWYGPSQRDYYGIEGPTVYAEGMFPLTEPDHDPLMP